MAHFSEAGYADCTRSRHISMPNFYSEADFGFTRFRHSFEIGYREK